MHRLLEDLIRADSVNPDLVPGGAGEAEAGRVVAEYMRAGGLDVSVTEISPGRPNVVGRTRSSGPGKTLLLLGHLDTVGVAGMDQPFTPRVDGDRLYGRGAYDMKSGLAAAVDAACALNDTPGQVIVAAVSDEEAAGAGTKALVADGLRPDAAIVTEPTDLAIVVAHKGYVSFEIETTGRAAHGSRADLGVDAILAMGPVLEALSALNAELMSQPPHPLLGTSTLHASIISGGQEFSSYPDQCLLSGECRTLPGQDAKSAILEAVDGSGVKADVRFLYAGEPFEVARSSEIVTTVAGHAGAEIQGAQYWTDAAQLAAAGIPTVLYGPSGGGAHAVEEWVDLSSVNLVREAVVIAAGDFC